MSAKRKAGEELANPAKEQKLDLERSVALVKAVTEQAHQLPWLGTHLTLEREEARFEDEVEEGEVEEETIETLLRDAITKDKVDGLRKVLAESRDKHPVVGFHINHSYTVDEKKGEDLELYNLLASLKPSAIGVYQVVISLEATRAILDDGCPAEGGCDAAVYLARDADLAALVNKTDMPAYPPIFEGSVNVDRMLAGIPVVRGALGCNDVVLHDEHDEGAAGERAEQRYRTSLARVIYVRM